MSSHDRTRCGGLRHQSERSAYCDWRVDPLDVCFLDQDLACFEAEFLDLLLRERLAAVHLPGSARVRFDRTYEACDTVQ